jgi:peptide deformylase
MAFLPILRWPDPRLSQICAPIAADQIAALAADLLETMYAAPGRGLAAPQIGRLQRLFVMDTGWKDGPRNPRICANPEILWRSPERATGAEGCLSLPGLSADVSRARSIRLRWQDAGAAPQEALLTGIDAICAQHEYDHLEGIVTLDHLSPATRAALIAEYQP